MKEKRRECSRKLSKKTKDLEKRKGMKVRTASDDIELEEFTKLIGKKR